MIKQRKIELLAPAKNLECGIAAIDHGADAVYIGAPRFGARAAAGNSLEDIAELVRYAHIYNVRIYVTVNTILRDEELKETEEMVWELYRIGVDALIVQDMALTRLNLPPIPLHASTQMDNRTPQKVKFLAEAGFRQVVLARELSLADIRAISDELSATSYKLQATSDKEKLVPRSSSLVPILEVFVHGALCVSYSGQCYVSQACFGRSANRGECAQFCRLAFDMVDADGKVIQKNKHLLSLKDLNQSDELENILDAGASSLKIEGRLKDVSYVKNVTAYYRRKLDAIFKRRKEYIPASSGKVTLDFKPQLDKSFSRGFTHYFLYERNKGIFSFDTPKSLGEEMGTVKELRGNYLTVAGVKPFNNGDGVCYLDERGKLQGFRVNKVENNRLYPQEMPRVKPRTVLYRNFDQEFERLMSRKSAERKIAVAMQLAENRFGFTLTMTDEDDYSVSVALEREKELARSPQADNLRNQLAKLGNTPFEATQIDIDWTDNWFIPSSVLADLRRQAVERLLAARRIGYPQETYRLPETNHPFPAQELTYLGNVMNKEAASFYRNHGVQRIAPAFELQENSYELQVTSDKDSLVSRPSSLKPEPKALMFCMHCLRYSMGWCPIHHKERSPFREPYTLVSADGKRFRLSFDCKVCQMKVYAE